MSESAPPAAIDRRTYAALAAITLAGLVLRIVAAHGGLWLDEAWSAVFARDAGTPMAVFFAINHDNNHFANTLWLQATGWGAPPLLSRGLAIFSGTASILVGGILNLRRGRGAALSAAVLLAVSPILVIYGAEARGYAPMMLGLLVSVAIVDRWLFVRRFGAAPALLGMAALFGVLGHVTFLVGLIAVAGWLVAALARRTSVAAAIVETMQLLRWAIAGVGFVMAMIAIVAVRNGGYRFGGAAPFAADALVDALRSLVRHTLGLGWPAGAVPLAALAIAIGVVLLRVPAVRDRAVLYLATILALPLAAVAFHIGNTGFARYFLVSALGLLLLAADLLGAGFRRGAYRRAIAALALGGFCAGSLLLNAGTVRGRRSDPGAAVQAMIARSPAGAQVLIENARSSAVLAAAAAAAAYPLAITEDACTGAPFLFVDADGTTPLPDQLRRCGQLYAGVTGRRLTGLSGLGWQLYVRRTDGALPR